MPEVTTGDGFRNLLEKYVEIYYWLFNSIDFIITNFSLYILLFLLIILILSWIWNARKIEYIEDEF